MMIDLDAIVDQVDRDTAPRPAPTTRPSLDLDRVVDAIDNAPSRFTQPDMKANEDAYVKQRMGEWSDFERQQRLAKRPTKDQLARDIYDGAQRQSAYGGPPSSMTPADAQAQAEQAYNSQSAGIDPLKDLKPEQTAWLDAQFRQSFRNPQNPANSHIPVPDANWFTRNVSSPAHALVQGAVTGTQGAGAELETLGAHLQALEGVVDPTSPLHDEQARKMFLAQTPAAAQQQAVQHLIPPTIEQQQNPHGLNAMLSSVGGVAPIAAVGAATGGAGVPAMLAAQAAGGSLQQSNEAVEGEFPRKMAVAAGEGIVNYFLAKGAPQAQAFGPEAQGVLHGLVGAESFAVKSQVANEIGRALVDPHYDAGEVPDRMIETVFQNAGPGAFFGLVGAYHQRKIEKLQMQTALAQQQAGMGEQLADQVMSTGQPPAPPAPPAEQRQQQSPIDAAAEKAANALTFDGEEGMQSAVVKNDRGFGVTLRDKDAGETLPTVRTFPNEADAVEHAKALVQFKPKDKVRFIDDDGATTPGEVVSSDAEGNVQVQTKSGDVRTLHESELTPAKTPKNLKEARTQKPDERAVLVAKIDDALARMQARGGDPQHYENLKAKRDAIAGGADYSVTDATEIQKQLIGGFGAKIAETATRTGQQPVPLSPAEAAEVGKEAAAPPKNLKEAKQQQAKEPSDRQKKKILDDAGYTGSTVYKEWPDGTVGYGRVVRHGDRYVGEVQGKDLLRFAWDDYQKQQQQPAPAAAPPANLKEAKKTKHEKTMDVLAGQGLVETIDVPPAAKPAESSGARRVVVNGRELDIYNAGGTYYYKDPNDTTSPYKGQFVIASPQFKEQIVAAEQSPRAEWTEVDRMPMPGERVRMRTRNGGELVGTYEGNDNAGTLTVRTAEGPRPLATHLLNSVEITTAALRPIDAKSAEPPPADESSFWLKGLPPERKESVYATMRDLDNRAAKQYDRARELSPKNGEVAVGGAHVDEQISADAIADYLRAIRRGQDPAAALEYAKGEARQHVETWNKSRKDYQVHRSPGTVDSMLEDVHRRIMDAADESYPVNDSPPAPVAPYQRPSDAPALRQYEQFKKQYPDYVMFFRRGDFYEAFHDDAKKVAKTTGVTLTSRNDVPIAGVPFHAVEGYLRRMIAAGHKVAIAEQAEPGQSQARPEPEVMRTMVPGEPLERAPGGIEGAKFVNAGESSDATPPKTLKEAKQRRGKKQPPAPAPEPELKPGERVPLDRLKIEEPKPREKNKADELIDLEFQRAQLRFEMEQRKLIAIEQKHQETKEFKQYIADNLKGKRGKERAREKFSAEAHYLRSQEDWIKQAKIKEAAEGASYKAREAKYANDRDIAGSKDLNREQMIQRFKEKLAPYPWYELDNHMRAVDDERNRTYTNHQPSYTDEQRAISEVLREKLAAQQRDMSRVTKTDLREGWPDYGVEREVELPEGQWGKLRSTNAAPSKPRDASHDAFMAGAKLNELREAGKNPPDAIAVPTADEQTVLQARGNIGQNYADARQWITKAASDGVNNLKEFIKTVPEFRLNPTFTVAPDGRLEFEGGGTFRFQPEHVGIVYLNGKVEPGTKIGVPVDALADAKRGHILAVDLAAPKPTEGLGQPIEAPKTLKEAKRRRGVAYVGFLKPAADAIRELATQDIGPTARKAWEATKEAAEDIKRIFAPQTRGMAARVASHVAREHGAELQRRYDRAVAAMEGARGVLAQMTDKGKRDFINRIETGRTQARPELQPFADTMRDLLDDRLHQVQALGRLQNFITDYFPHLWSDHNKASSIFGKPPLEGPKSFLKMRTIPTIEDGIAKGLTPLYDNPVDMVVAKVREMDKFILAQHMLRELRSGGMMRLIRARDPMPLGFARINDPVATVYGKPNRRKAILIKGYYVAPEPIANVLNNYLSPGLRHQSAFFRAYLSTANVLNQAQLGLSAFHLGFTSIDASTSKLALAVERLARGDVKQAALDVAETPIAWATGVFKGNKVINEWMDPGSMGPEFRKIVDGLKSGGYRPFQDSFYRTDMVDRFKKALQDGNPLGAAWRAPFAALELTARPLMEWIVPRQKAAVAFDLARLEFDKLGNNPTHRMVRDAMARVVDSVDNRMGQLIYDNLFWKKWAKDVTMATQRSVGWNLGTLRELGGGGLDFAQAGADAMRGRKPILTHRMAYTIAMPVLAGFIGAVTHYLMTGKPPEDFKDAFFPRTGEKDLAGHDIRLALPTYMKDVLHYRSHPVQTIQNKLHPALELASEMLSNRDYYGTKIRNEDDPFYKQIIDSAAHVGKSMEPFGIREYRKLSESGEPAWKKSLPFVGVVQAPKDLSMTDAEQKAQEITRDRLPAGARTTEQAERAQLRVKIAGDVKRDPATGRAEARDAIKSGTLAPNDWQTIREMTGKPPLVRAVTGMNVEDGLKVYQVATDDEKRELLPLLVSKFSNAESLTPERRKEIRAVLVAERNKFFRQRQGS